MLREELAAVRDRFLDRAPTHVKQSVAEATASLIESGVGQGLQVGEKAPDFTLVNATGEKVTLSELLKDGKVILNFYRGGWCPYCNLELKAYERILPKIKQKGAQLVAISPQMPDESLSTSEKNNLTFEVLSDPNQQVAESYRLLFDFPDHLIQTYETDFGLQLAHYNGDANPWRLPVPATFVIDQNGTIQFAEADPDYMVRPDPERVIASL